MEPSLESFVQESSQFGNELLDLTKPRVTIQELLQKLNVSEIADTNSPGNFYHDFFLFRSKKEEDAMSNFKILMFYYSFYHFKVPTALADVIREEIETERGEAYDKYQKRLQHPKAVRLEPKYWLRAVKQDISVLFIRLLGKCFLMPEVIISSSSELYSKGDTNVRLMKKATAKDEFRAETRYVNSDSNLREKTRKKLFEYFQAVSSLEDHGIDISAYYNNEI